ncbi:MAG: heparan-alpha-glucosaminide N-acetyltransferase domain-containing protein [Acidobacteriota bacterium]
MQYLDWLRGLAVTAMVLAHLLDSWTSVEDRNRPAFHTLIFVGGVASPLFLFLAGLASALSASSKARRLGSHAAGAAAARRRGWEIFALGLVFRLQSQVLGLGPLTNLFRVDILNIMGLSIVAATWLWQAAPRRRWRIVLFAVATTVVTMVTPLVRAAGWLDGLPDPLEAYLRPAGSYAAFPWFPWAGFVFAGVLVGDLVDEARTARLPQPLLQSCLVAAPAAGVWLAWRASFQPPLYETAQFWHDSPTFFFIRLGLVVLTIPSAWLIERLSPAAAFQPLLTMGRSSLFVYWIHVEMVYGVIADPVKGELPLWGSLVSTALLCLLLHALVLLKNRLVRRHGLKGPFKVLEPLVR